MASIVKRVAAGSSAFIFAVFSVVFPVTATAAVSSAVASIAGYASGAYKASAPLSLVSNAFNVSSVVQVGGKSVIVPAAMRLASNAPAFAVAAIRLNPTALVVGSVAAWLLTQGIKYIDGQLVKQTNGGVVILDHFPALAEVLPIGTSVAYAGHTYKSFPSEVHCGGSGPPSPWVWYGGYVQTGESCGYAAVYSQSGMPQTNTVPVTDSDFAPLQVANLPDAVAGELIQKTPLPVIDPVINPVDVPMSVPRLDPVTGRQVQDYARVTPSPVPGNPLSVDVQTYEKDVQPTGTPEPSKDKFPDDYNREVTQKDLLKELKADGAPAQPDWAADVTQRKTDQNKEIKDAAEAIPGQQDAEKNKFFSWVWTPPVHTCAPIGGGMVRGATFTGWNLCSHVETIRNAMGYLLAIFSSLLIYGQLFRSNDS